MSKAPRFEIQEITSPTAATRYRIILISTGSQLADCYSYDNAAFIRDELNAVDGLREQLAKAQNAIKCHNAECDRLCNNKKNCGWENYTRRCPNCALHWKIDLIDAAKDKL